MSDMNTKLIDVDPTLRDFIVLTEVDSGPVFAQHIFQRKFHQDCPDFPHHIVAFYITAGREFVPASYAHFRPYKSVYLAGGGCTDGNALQNLSEDEKTKLTVANGLLLQTMRYGFIRFADQCEAYFGYCGDDRAWGVFMEAGFEPTSHKHLIARWHKEVSEQRKTELIEEVFTIGPF